MTLSEYAKRLGISYRTAWNHFKSNKIEGAYKLKSGTIIVPDETEDLAPKEIAIYTRISSSENKGNLVSQAERVRQWSVINGYTVIHEVSEIGSGLNDGRKKLLKLLDNQNVSTIIVEHQDRLTRFGFNYIDCLLRSRGGGVVVINHVDNDREALIQDFISVITSFCARIYGQRRTKRKTEKLIKELSKDD